MIDMSSLYRQPDYPLVLFNFTNSTKVKKWSIFQSIQCCISRKRCPICECLLDGSVTRNSYNGVTTLASTIDHYRPQKHYPKLKYDDKNYLLMCSDCNNAYKGNDFPLHSSGGVRDTVATDTVNITNEAPLIVNPIYDNLLDLFILVLCYSPSGKKVLELKPKHNAGYSYEKAKETIRVFSLGECEVNIHSNANVQTCRITLLNDHFKKFYDFIKALEEKKSHVALNLKNQYKLEHYGFYIFIMRRQYENLIS